jgi:uracil DNA glycosylase
MLNTCLTVKAGSPGSHSNKGWEKFTDKVIAVIDKWGGANLPAADTGSATRVGVGRGIVFMAWGSWAQKRVSGLNRVSQVLVPLPLSKATSCCLMDLSGVVVSSPCGLLTETSVHFASASNLRL